jgi:hypothetical protein
MTKSNCHPTTLPIALMLALAACGSARDQIEVRAEKRCITIRDDQELFLGTRECLRTLPKSEIFGFLAVGHEYSVFYSTLASVKFEFRADATWVEMSDDVQNVVNGFFDGEQKVFEVRFIGAVGPRGVYGRGIYQNGALIDRLISIKEVPKPSATPIQG